MNQGDYLTGVLLDEVALTLDEFAQACGVEPGWVVTHVKAGTLGIEVSSVQLSEWRFGSGELGRARRMLDIERRFDANEDLAALVVDLVDEVRRLRVRLQVVGG